MPDTVTMDKIVSLCRRRGFVFPSSEIYGGLGSAYDYGHYGVLLKNNVKARWLEAMTQERDDIVALDSAIVLHPSVWEASGPRRRVQRSAGRLPDVQAPLPRRPPRRPGARRDPLRQAGRASAPARPSDCDLTEARQFNLMLSTRLGAVEETGVARVPPARDRAGHLRQLQERRPARAAQAAVRDRADRQVVPQRDHARELPLPHPRVRADGDGVLRPARRGRAVVPLLDRRAPRLVPALRAARQPPARPPARRGRALALLAAGRATSSTSSRSAGRSSRGSRTAATTTCTQHAELSGTKLE